VEAYQAAVGGTKRIGRPRCCYIKYREALMLQLLHYFLLIFAFGAAIGTAYLVVLAVGAYCFRKRVNYAGESLKLAVVIPAYNEESGIGETITCVRSSIYPEDRYSIFVVADNCSDRTAERARERGALVFERTDPLNRGKGQNLDWFFKNHKGAYASFDGVAIIDADTRIDPHFLKEISASLKYPAANAVQGYNGVGNPRDHWRSGLLCAAFHVFNHLRPAGANAFGTTAGLRGNGMAFRTDILLENGWPAYSNVEDYEFSLQLLMKGVFVHYNPDAMVFSDMPVRGKPVETQRMRWEEWCLGMKVRYSLLLLRQFLKRPNIPCITALISFFVPPLSLLVLGELIVLGVSFSLNPAIALLMALCLLMDIFYVFSGLIQRRAEPVVWLSLLSAPVYVLWKIPLYVKMITRQQNGWVRTKRSIEL
jgi:cellulose synthase/poly-beta-1,6-N-acetylglucosamine synthase-like glycosyltransferase